MVKIPPFNAKTCSVCGSKKSASSFLLLSEGKETYSNICSSCRSIQAKSDKDSGTRSNTGVVIDSKSKVHSDITKQQQEKQIEEDYHKERDETEAEEKEEKEEHLELTEKETTRRQKEKTKSFLDSTRKPVSRQKQTSRWAINQTVEREQNIQQSAEQEASNSEEQQKTQTNFAAPFEDTRIGGKLKFTGEHFQRFASWVGKGSPISRTLSQGDAKQEPATQSPKEKPSEFTERKWGPGSKKP